MTRLDQGIADASALLAITGVLPIEPPDVVTMLAPDAALVDVITVLRAYHDGRTADVLGDLAIIGVHVTGWLSVHDAATDVAELAIAHSEQLPADLVAIAAARQTGLPVVTGQARLASLDASTAVVVLPRRPT